MRRMPVAIVLVLSILAGCDNTGLSKTSQGAIAGTALGAGLGAIVGDQVHHTGTGTAIGAGFGALTGGLVGAGMDSSGKDREAEDERLRRQEEELRRQRREIEELRRERGDYYSNPRPSPSDRRDPDYDYRNDEYRNDDYRY